MQLPKFTFSALLFAFQLILMVLYGAFVDYEVYNAQESVISGYYPMFQDVHIMLFVGFPFLMAFLKRHGFSSSGFTLIVGAVIIQWGMLVTGLISNAANGVDNPTKVKIGVKSMLSAEFNTCTILISFATILGKASRIQYLFIAIIETVFFNINEMILTHHLVISDAGGSVIIHMFGCYFGLAVAKALERDETTKEESPKESSSYNSDLIAMLGTCILWALWPSFNSSFLGPNAQQARCILNTYLSLATSCVMTYVISPLLNKNGKLNMVHIQNATLAGGVAVGTAAHLFIKPWAAMLCGFFGGFICMVAFNYLTPFLRKSFGIHDTCGVHNLHGLPGIFSGIVAAIAASNAELDQYGNDLFAIWPARAPKRGTAEFARLIRNYTLPTNGSGRSKGGQAGMQLAAIPVTILIAVISGLLTGFMARVLELPHKDHLFDDEGSWEIPQVEEPCNDNRKQNEASSKRDEDIQLPEMSVATNQGTFSKNENEDAKL